eukprot:CAMPEP_0174289576 /NCGR_PEP_ID=MMETSP0809-20121228/25523_1 /TAXON_ID=73025 ORGANISM="Eutreptiella gymnastica-like, Strain CCMP1594" /NCGR_SAMPLE_ID=MMETSP0809 /ASSEMBLY_ACC=CAM_ASM_000658 /LENGTH=73 /DNA_ID=CAMNT_0015387611 /DNA_START=372 /DNA_END=593 /DNA_ORIENTATION=-
MAQTPTTSQLDPVGTPHVLQLLHYHTAQGASEEPHVLTPHGLHKRHQTRLRAPNLWVCLALSCIAHTLETFGR